MTGTTGDGFLPLRVLAVERDTDDSAVVTFDTTGAAVPFRHGQHLTLRRSFDGVEVRRSYSICSAAGGALRVGVRRVPGGAMSTWVTESLRPGDVVEVLPPSGHFTHELDPHASRRYTLLAAGSGITPILSIAATVLATEPRAAVSLVYVNRSSRSVMLLDELHDLLDRHLGRLRVAFAFTREVTEAPLLSGRPDRDRLDAWIVAGLLPADVDHAFLCGPIELVAATHDALVDAGLAHERIHRELFTTGQFGVAAAPAPVTERSVAVAHGRATLHGRTTEFEVYEGDSVLDAVQRVRPDAPYSCRSGVCSTCQAVLRDGTVEMAVNYGLSADEVARGYVLTCQSRPTATTLDVDFDA
jgi:ring-1,2-phenylacetyl-CoA epoxidase subunit PaaE